MEKSNLELFREALFEAMSSKTNEADLAEKIEPSDRHKDAMQAILDGTYERKSVWKLTKAKIAAIIVAAALLLAGCAYRNEIRDIIEEIYDKYIHITYSDEGANGKTIEEVYELTYVPEGYVLEESSITPATVRYEFCNNADRMIFYQYILDDTDFYVDGENGYTIVVGITDYSVYYRKSNDAHYYLWNDGRYAMKLTATKELSIEELQSIIDGMR